MKRKSTEQLTKDLENIIKRLHKNEEMEAVRKIVEDTLLEAEKDIIRQAMELVKTKKDRIVELLKDLKSQQEIKTECQCSQSYVSLVAKSNKIYSRKKVYQLIQEGKNIEDIASEGNVNLDAVIRLKEELEREKKASESKKNNKEKEGRTSKDKKIIELAKDLIEDSEIAERVQCTKSHSCYIRNKEKICAKRKVQKMLADGMSVEDIALEGNVNLDAVIKLREQLKENKKEKPKKKRESIISDKIINMAVNLIPPKEIASMAYSDITYVYTIMRREGIYSKRKVEGLIQSGKSAEEISKEGKINLDAVVRLKEELERNKEDKESNSNKKAKGQIDEKKRKKIIELAKRLKSRSEIARIAQTNNKYVKMVMEEEGILTRANVKQLIKEGKSAEEIAKEGNVNLDVVISLKNEFDELRRRKEAKIDGTVLGAVYGKRKIIALIKANKTSEEIADLGNVSVEQVEAIREQLKQEKTAESHKPNQQETKKSNDAIVDKKVINKKQQDDKRQEQSASDTSISSQITYKNTSEDKRNKKDDKKIIKSNRVNTAILQMARLIKSVDKIVAVSGIPEYTVRNMLRKNNILPREDIISLINKGEKTMQEIAQEAGVDVKALEGLHKRIVAMRQSIERNPKRKQALELLQKGKGENEVVATTRLKREIILEMKELIIGRVEKPISIERKQTDFKLNMFNLRSSINAIQEHSSRIQAETTDLKIQKILYLYPEFIGRKEYAFFAYAYAKVSEYMKAMDIGEEYLGLETPSISALKNKIEEVLQEEKERVEGQQAVTNKTEVASTIARLEDNVSAEKTVKQGQDVGDSSGDGHSER